MKKRILSILLAALMLVSLMPMAAFAADQTVSVGYGFDHVIQASVEISGSTIAFKPFKDADIDRVVCGEYVEIDLRELKNSIDTVKFPAETLEKISKTDGIYVHLSTASVTFDREILQKIASQADGGTVQLAVKNIKASALNEAQQEAVGKLETALVVDAYLMSNGTRLYTEDTDGFGDVLAILDLPLKLEDGRIGANYKVFYVDEQGNLQDMQAHYSAWDSSFGFEIGHFSNYVIAYVENGYADCAKDADCPMAAFGDLNVSAWYHDGVHYCLDNGLMNGISDTQFAPADTITRGMIVTMLWRLDEQRYPAFAMRFKDAEGQWCESAVRWAAAEKIVSGYDAEHFGPNDPVTREQLATILYNYAKYKGQGFTGSWMFLLDFADRASISDWADEAVHWCSMNGVINGKDGKVFDPQGCATRAEAAAMMQRFCDALKK